MRWYSVSGIELATHFAEAPIHHHLHRLELGFGSEGAQVLDLVGADGRAFGQCTVLNGSMLRLLPLTTCAGAPRRPAGTSASVSTVLLDLNDGGGDALLVEQAERRQPGSAHTAFR